MDEDENLSTLLAMGFPDLSEIKRALRLAKNDLNEAVAILTNEQPVFQSPALSGSSSSHIEELASLDIDMKDSASGSGSGSGTTTGDDKDGADQGFPVQNFYELEQRVFQDNWSIPYKPEESLGKCLVAATRLAKDGLMDAHDHCVKFHERVLPEAFRKLLTSNAIQRWQLEIQEGIYDMLQLFIDLILARIKTEPVPVGLLNILATAFDLKNDWNHKNRDRQPRGLWRDFTASVDLPQSNVEFARPSEDTMGRKQQYQWLVELINQFGQKGGFRLVQECFQTRTLNVREMAALIAPVSKCVELLDKEHVKDSISILLEHSFSHIEKMDDSDLKSKEVTAVSDLLASLKVIGIQLWPETDHVENCDRLRLNMICRMLKTPHFSSKMNALKEVSRLIDECKSTNVRLKQQNNYIGVDQIVEWMADNRVLSVALEGNIDQVQYTDRIKAIVEFLGPRLSNDELSKMWHLQESANAHVMDNVYAIMASAAAQFNLSQFEHLTSLIRETWAKSNDRVRENLLILIGQIGKEATQFKSTQAILTLLWEVSHLDILPKQLVEKALSEQLAILTEMTSNKDPMRKTYVMKCVEDIKNRKPNMLAAVKHLHDICRSYSRGTSIYQKADKATLGELNKQHEIVKLLSLSLRHCHEKSKQAATDKNEDLTPSTMSFDQRYTHEEIVYCHLDIMKFFLKEGDLYLSWARCKELWDTLVDNPNAIEMDRDMIFNWFETCITDLEADTQMDLFSKKLLSMNAEDTTKQGFDCFKKFFENINLANNNMRKGPSQDRIIVEKLNLVGVEFLWRVIAESRCQKIADMTIQYLLNIRFNYVSAKLKADSLNLHKEFINHCYKRLDNLVTLSRADDYEVEACVVNDKASPPKQVSSVKISQMSSLPPKISGAKLLRLNRLLLLTERYISNIEEAYGSNRTMVQHAASFHGTPITIAVHNEVKKEEFLLQSHQNEMIGDVKTRLLEVLQLTSLDQLVLQHLDHEITPAKDSCLVGTLDPGFDHQNWVLKNQSTTTTSSSTALVVFNNHQDGKSTPIPSPSSSASTSSGGASRSRDSSMRKSFTMEEGEKCLPGVIMASDVTVFNRLYQIAGSINDNRTLKGIRRLIHLIPTDPSVLDVLEGITYHSDSSPRASADASPKLSPRNPKKLPSKPSANLEEAREQLSILLDANHPTMNPFRVLYNLEVLSGRLMPTRPNSFLKVSSEHFSRQFLDAGGLKMILNILEKNSLPADLDPDIRQSAYHVTLQLVDHLLCGHSTGTPNPTTSPVIKPTPPKRSALDSSVAALVKSPTVLSATKIVQTMAEGEFSEMISRLMRVVWAAAAGKLHLASAGFSVSPNSEHPRFFASRRSRDSSTGSSGSESSFDVQTLHAGVCAQQSIVSSGDCHIAEKAMELLVTCLQLRSTSLSSFYSLPLVNEFIIEILLGSPSAKFRWTACDQLNRLCKIKVAARCLNLDGDSTNSNKSVTPFHFLTKTLLKTPVPLWAPSCRARGLSHTILGQSTQYFSLRCSLLKGLSVLQLDQLEENANSMIEDELLLLQNFSPCRAEDCTLLAGHLRLVEALLSCEGVDKQKVGKCLIPDLLTSFLFPASRLMAEGGLNNLSSSMDTVNNINPKCDTGDSRKAAYDLLVELSRDCPENLILVTTELVKMHHSFNEDILKDFEYEPAVARRGPSNFVGLKNAGATCYMNSVLQQLFCTPAIYEQILSVNLDSVDEETIFFQLQNVFGHLSESKLQFYEPEKFWKCFRLFGQPVNVREQQDAFEFFTQIVDQVDEFLSKNKKPKVFASRFEGVFSDQKICQGCPHRYEREQTFMALNLTVKSNNLQESLDQFVKGELLDGDNAYFCEKCQAKRNTIKRMCIRKLPQTLVLQLKRFHFDWETNRAVKFDDFFEFPWTLDMSPYTTEGIQRRESVSGSSKSKFGGPQLNVNNQQYELVGVVVHSGQANAGHYYSFIKDRKHVNGIPPFVTKPINPATASASSSSSNPASATNGPTASSGVRSKWYKFNDTTVESFEMTEEALATECFGGMYKVKKDNSNSNLPENRQRYWNAYILVYEALNISSGPNSAITPKKTMSQSYNQHQRLSARKVSSSRTSEPSAARESLSELSNLLEKGEKKGLFANRMPAAIERGIQEENLRFLENRDVFCDGYYEFVLELMKTTISWAERNPGNFSKVAVQAISLGVNFLVNTYFHLKNRQLDVMKGLMKAISNLLRISSDATDWLLGFLTNDSVYLRPYLVECAVKEVRTHFAELVFDAIWYFNFHNGNTEIDHINRIMATLVGLIEKDIPNHCKYSAQFFWLLAKFTEMGVVQCQQLFQLNTFSQLTKFLLGVEPDPEEMSSEQLSKQRRRWTSVTAKEFGELHRALAFLIASCDLSEQRTVKVDETTLESKNFFKPTSKKLPLPTTVSSVLYGPIAPLFIREAVSAIREVNGLTFGVRPIIDMLILVSVGSKPFSESLLEEIMKQYKSVNSGELKNLSTLLLEVLTLDDPLQSVRIKFIIEGNPDLNLIGLLQLVRDNQNTDSCRSYQCIKTLVNASNKSLVVKEYLLQDSDRWQWSVNWLKSKMTDYGSTYYTPSIDPMVSNEDPTTRTFHRTTSAQVTLDEANAILAEFGGEATEKMETEADTSSDSPTTTTAKTEDLLQHPKEEDEDAEMPQLQEIEEEMTDVNCSEKKRKD